MTQTICSEDRAAAISRRLLRLYGSQSGDKAAWDSARERFRALGIDGAVEARVRERRGGCLFGVGKVATRRLGFFDYAEDGDWHCIVPELLDGLAIDLVAFPLDQPQRVCTLRGRASMLNEEDADYRAFTEREITLWDDPVQWLRAGAEGSVVLQLAPPPGFLATATLVCASLDLTRRLRRAYASPPPPQPTLKLQEGLAE